MRSISILLTAFLSACGQGAYERPQPQDETPRLVVVLTIDQMRNDYLDLDGEHFSGGFRRLLDGGFRYENAWVDHAMTNSYPGHAAIATGAYPNRHGLVDNSWLEEVDGEWTTVSAGALLRDACAAGAPPAMKVKTIGERVLNAGGKFVAVSSASQIVRAYGGQAAAPVIRLSVDDGGFRTIECYGPEQPDWLTAFNENVMPNYIVDRWDLTAPSEVVSQLRTDASAFEGEAGDDIAFPHEAPTDIENLLSWSYNTPFSDEALFELAKTAIDAEELGQDETPDLIHVSLNTIDNVGHDFGPFSVEQTDNLFRADAALGAFMGALDRMVGEGNWVLALTGDHGAAPAPESREAASIPTARRISGEEVAAVIAAAHQAAGPYAQDDPARVSAVIETLESYDFVEAALTHASIRERAGAGDPIAAVYVNSLIEGKIPRHPFYSDDDGRSIAEFGVMPLLAENVVVDWATSIHGSPYDYDRRVPIVFYGAGVGPGSSERMVRTVDIAPTLMGMIGVAIEDEIDGVVLPVGE